MIGDMMEVTDIRPGDPTVVGQWIITLSCGHEVKWREVYGPSHLRCPNGCVRPAASDPYLAGGRA